MQNKIIRFSVFLAAMLVNGCGNTPSTVTSLAQTYSPPPHGGVRLHVLVNVLDSGAYVSDMEEWQSPHSIKAVSRMSQRSMNYREGNDTVEVLEAYTLKRNGERHDVTPDRILIQQPPIAANAPMYGDMRVKTIIFPDVEVGDYLVTRTRTTHHAADFPGQYSSVYVFPRAQPLEDVQITYRFPKNYPLQFDARGVSLAVQRDEGNVNERTWIYQNLQAVPTEAGGVDPFDYDPKLIVSSFQNWHTFATQFEAMRRDTAAQSPAIAQLANRITEGLTTPRAQAEAIYRWVSLNIRYVAIYLGAGGYIPHDAAEVATNRYGDCKDHSTLLEALLAAKGIDSTPVLVNTHPRYTTSELPFAQAFNHMMTYVPAFDTYLDSTAGVLPFGELSEGTADKPVMWVRGAAQPMHTTPALSAAGDTVKTTLTLTIASEGYATGQADVIASGTPALPMRLLMLRSNGHPSLAFVRARLSEYGLYGSGQIHGDEAQLLSDPYNLQVGLRLANLINGEGALHIPAGLFSPRPIRALAGQLSRPFATVDHPCSGSALEETVTLIFPRNVTLDRVPQDVHYSNPLGQFDATYTLNDHTVTAMRQLHLTPTAATCSPVEMNQLRKLAEAVHNDNDAQVFYR